MIPCNPRQWYELWTPDAIARFVSLLQKIQGEREILQFASSMDVKVGTLSLWLKAESLPTPRHLQVIANVAGLSLTELYAYLGGAPFI